MGLRKVKLDDWKERGKLRLTKNGIARRENSTLDTIRRLTLEYCEREEIQKDIMNIADSLVSHRTARCTDRQKWELWATGIRYRCTVDECDKAQKLRPSKSDLQTHVRKLHWDHLEGKTEVEKQVELDKLVSRGYCAY